MSESVNLTGLPDRVVVDQHGHFWQDFGDYWSMCRVSDENVETEVAAAYIREGSTSASVRLDALAEALMHARFWWSELPDPKARLGPARAADQAKWIANHINGSEQPVCECRRLAASPGLIR